MSFASVLDSGFSLKPQRRTLFILGIGLFGLALIAALVSQWAWRRHLLQQRFLYRLPVSNSSMSAEGSIALTTKNLEKDPDNFMDLNTLAELYLSVGRRTGDLSRYDFAMKAAQRSLKVAPTGNAGAEIVLAHILEDQHQFEAAIQSALKILHENPNNQGIYSILITSYLAQGNLVQAQTFADLLVRRSPKVGSIALRGLVLISSGREDEGVFDLEKSLTVEDLGEEADSTWARCILARYFLSRHRLAEARVLLDEALRISPRFPLALDLKAQLEARVEHWQEAEQLFDSAFSQSHQVVFLRHRAELDFMTGHTQLGQDRWAQAEKFIRLDLEKGLYGHRLELAKILLRRNAAGDLSEAKVLCEKELEIRQSAEAYFLLASILFETKDLPKSLGLMLTLLRSGAREPRYYNLIAKIYGTQGLIARSEMYNKLASDLDFDYDPQRTFQ